MLFVWAVLIIHISASAAILINVYSPWYDASVVLNVWVGKQRLNSFRIGKQKPGIQTLLFFTNNAFGALLLDCPLVHILSIHLNLPHSHTWSTQHKREWNTTSMATCLQSNKPFIKFDILSRPVLSTNPRQLASSGVAKAGPGRSHARPKHHVRPAHVMRSRTKRTRAWG